jgi:ubiquinone/menaquinone biosynthesis C-methylase UbiE
VCVCVCVFKNKFPIYKVNEFGIAHLRSGSGVLDVAGGRGVITAKAKTKIII